MWPYNITDSTLLTHFYFLSSKLQQKFQHLASLTYPISSPFHYGLPLSFRPSPFIPFFPFHSVLPLSFHPFPFIPSFPFHSILPLSFHPSLSFCPSPFIPSFPFHSGLPLSSRPSPFIPSFPFNSVLPLSFHPSPPFHPSPCLFYLFILFYFISHSKSAQNSVRYFLYLNI